MGVGGLPARASQDSSQCLDATMGEAAAGSPSLDAYRAVGTLPLLLFLQNVRGESRNPKAFLLEMGKLRLGGV